MAFQPYHIHHIQFSETNCLSIPKHESAYLLFWWNQIPLGHIWYVAGEPLPNAARIIEAVSSALDHYSRQRKLGADWRAMLQQGQMSALKFFLEDLFKRSSVAKHETLSVVVCTRNRAAQLANCIRQILACTDQDFELIIVDNAPDDDATKMVVAQFPHVRYVLEPRKGLDIARNTGAQAASGEIIAYTDDDVLVPENWISQLREAFHHPQVMAVTGLVVPHVLKTKAQYIFEHNWGFNKGYLPVLFDRDYFFAKLPYGVPVWDIGAGANMAFRKAAFQLAGYFDERLDVGASGCSGDSEMWYRILAEGWSCYYDPALYVFHEHRDTIESLSKQLFSYMRGQVSSLLVQHERYGHEGNLKRVFKYIPEYYLKRIWKLLTLQVRENPWLFWQEIRGAYSGWRFFQENKGRRQSDPLLLPAQLGKPAEVKSDTLVSVIIPCYNQGRFLQCAIDSVLAQTYPHIEIIVVNDGSVDHTADICAAYPQVKYVSIPNSGVSIARNIGVAHSSGDYLVFLDADDILYENAIELNLYFFTYYRDAVMVCGGYTPMNENGEDVGNHVCQTKSANFFQDLLMGNFIGLQSVVMYRRALFFTFAYDTQLAGSEDYDLHLRIAQHYPVYQHDRLIAKYRKHAQSASANTQMMYDTVQKVYTKLEPTLTPTQQKIAEQGKLYWKQYYQIDATAG